MTSTLPFPDIRTPKRCQHCGAKLEEYLHSLNSGLVTGLIRLYSVGGESKLEALNLTLSQSNNFQKLQYWSLVEKGKSGVWRITLKGMAFIRGEQSVRRSVRTFRKRWTGWEGDSVRVSDVIKDFDYRRREDYVRDSVGHR